MKTCQIGEHLFKKMWSGLVDLVFPAVCAGCRKTAAGKGGLCEKCEVDLLELVSRPYCVRCGAGIGPGMPVEEDGCSRCPVPLPPFERIVRLGPYEPPLCNILTALKYHGDTTMTGRLGKMLAVALRQIGKSHHVVIPVPMHFFRFLASPVHHAGEIARAVGRNTSIPLSHELLRVKNTPRQAGLSRSRRLANLSGAFRVKDPGQLEGAKVLLVDDVITTTTTAAEAARTLLAAGAASVTLAVPARTEE